jgi:uncharacterized protein (DUF2237 family)
MSQPKNVLGGPLLSCSTNPLTGFFRDGCCDTGPDDVGQHTVCALMTREFLEFSVIRGNDLVTPHPEWNFPGLKPGDFWCLCVLRWREGFLAGCAPKVRLEATHEDALKYVRLEDLQAHAVGSPEPLDLGKSAPTPTPNPEWN